MKPKDKKMKPKLILDGKTVPEEEYIEKGKEIQRAVTLSNKETLAFSSVRGFEKWIASSSKADAYLQEKKRMNQAIDLIHKVGEDKAYELFDKLQGSLNQAADCMNRLALEMPEAEKFLHSEGMIKLYKTLLSSKVGTVLFFRDPEYENWFLRFQGIFHITSGFVGFANNDALSSLIVIQPAIVTLFEDAYWEGRSWTFFGPCDATFDERSSTWFDDLMSSYWFWL